MSRKLVDVFTSFENLTDPRIERTRRHELFDLIVVALCATIAGSDSFGANKYNLYLTGTAVNYLAGYLGVGTAPNSAQVLTVTPGTATDKGLVVKGAPSQTGDLAQFQNSSGTVLAAVTSAGRLSFNATGSAPANTTTPAAWLDITVAGMAYKLPLYS